MSAAQIGDAILRVRVATVTAKKDGPEAIYQLGLHTVEKLAGKNAPPTDFNVQISKTSEAHGILKNFESRLVGYRFRRVRARVRAAGRRPRDALPPRARHEGSEGRRVATHCRTRAAAK